jgi:hypothetical protein
MLLFFDDLLPPLKVLLVSDGGGSGCGCTGLVPAAEAASNRGEVRNATKVGRGVSRGLLLLLLLVVMWVQVWVLVMVVWLFGMGVEGSRVLKSEINKGK